MDFSGNTTTATFISGVGVNVGKTLSIGSASLARSIRIRFHFRHRTGRIRSVSDHRAGRVWRRVIDPKHQIVYLAHVTRCRRCSEMRLSGAEPVWIQTAARLSHKVHLICCDAWPICYHYWTDDCIDMITRMTMHYFKCNRMENDNILFHTHVTLQIGTHINKKSAPLRQH